MKYKVGDRVRIRGDLEDGRSYDGYFVVKHMLPYLGEEAEIRIVGDDYYDIDIDDGIYGWTDEMLEDIPAAENLPVPSEQSILFLDESDVSGGVLDNHQISRQEILVNSLVENIRKISTNDLINLLYVVECGLCPLNGNGCDPDSTESCRGTVEEWLKG